MEIKINSETDALHEIVRLLTTPGNTTPEDIIDIAKRGITAGSDKSDTAEWPTSSMIDKAEYSRLYRMTKDARIRTLLIHFKNGKSYQYFDLPESEWQELKATQSIGGFFNTRIKGKYKSEEFI